MNASARTMKYYKEQGIYHVWSVERYITAIHKRIDLFHLFDLIVLGDSIIGVQVTTSNGHAEHKRNMIELLSDPNHAGHRWMELGGGVLLHSWGKKKVKRGGKAVRWTLREEEITMGDLS